MKGTSCPVILGKRLPVYREAGYHLCQLGRRTYNGILINRLYVEIMKGVGESSKFGKTTGGGSRARLRSLHLQIRCRSPPTSSQVHIQFEKFVPFKRGTLLLKPENAGVKVINFLVQIVSHL